VNFNVFNVSKYYKTVTIRPGLPYTFDKYVTMYVRMLQSSTLLQQLLYVQLNDIRNEVGMKRDI